MAKIDFSAQSNANFDWEAFYRYNGRDAANTLAIALVEKDLLKVRGTEATFAQEMALTYPLITAECIGIKVDPAKIEELSEQISEIIRKWKLYIQTLVGYDINPNSSQQLQEYLYDRLKYPKRVKKGKITVDVDALISLIPYNPVLIKPIAIYRKLIKEYSFYKVKVGEDGRVRTTLKPAGTETGRLASSKSITGTGTNLQNQPKIVRQIYIPDEGNIFLQVDYGKAESWLVAYMAQDQKMLDALRGPDFHSTNASNFLGRPVTKADYADRQIGKKVSHARNYRMTAFLLQKVMLREGFNLSKSDCQDLLDKYDRSYPNIKNVYHKWVEEQLRRDMTIANAFGRKITYFGFWNDALLNAATAFYPQSTVGDMTNKALINLYEQFRNRPVWVNLQVHDSILLQMPKAYLTWDLIDEIRGCMAVPLTVRGETFTIGVDFEAGYDWYHLDDLSKHLPA